MLSCFLRQQCSHAVAQTRMSDPKNPFLDYRSPYVWQSRALNFNRQLINKLNHIQKYNPKPLQARTKKIGIPQHRNGPFQHRLLEASASSSSLSPSPSSQEGAREEGLYASRYLQINNAHVNKLARNCIEYPSPANRGNAAFLPPGITHQGGRCPVHSLGPNQAFKHSSQGHLDGNRFTPLAADMNMYGFPSNHYLSRPYGYGFLPDSQYLSPYPPYYSSLYDSAIHNQNHMYLPGSYMSVPYISGNHLYSKHLSPQHRSHSYEYGTTMRLYPEPSPRRSKCRGHLIVLAIILTVITIGVVMGILLAVNIN